MTSIKPGIRMQQCLQSEWLRGRTIEQELSIEKANSLVTMPLSPVSRDADSTIVSRMPARLPASQEAITLHRGDYNVCYYHSSGQRRTEA